MNSKESLINGVNKPFMGLFLFTDSMIIGDEIERIVIGVEKRSVILHISSKRQILRLHLNLTPLL